MKWFKRKVKGTMINPVLCKGCRFLKISGGHDVSGAPTGSTARCKAPASKKARCNNWTTDLDEVERLFGIFDVASPEGMRCVECTNFDGGKCPHVKLYDDGQHAPRVDRHACLHYQHIKYLEQDVEAEAKVME